MPTLSQLQVPPPTDADEFEEIALTAMKIRWGSSTLQRHGRNGQAQEGVDIYGPDDVGRHCGVQCKATAGDLAFKTVEDEVEKAEAFVPPIECLWVVTSAPRDAKLQRRVRLLSEARLRDKKFGVGVFFWEDLLQDLVRNPKEFSRHYPEIRLGDVAPDGATLMSVLDLAYFGLFVRSYMSLLFGEIGSMVEDPIQFELLMRTVEGAATEALSESDSREVSLLSRALAEGSLSLARGEAKGDWRPLNDKAASIEAIVEKASYAFKGRELAALTAGRFLGTWSSVDFDEIAGSFEQDLLQAVEVLVEDNSLSKKIAEDMREYSDGDSMKRHNIPHRAYSRLRKALRIEAMKG